MGTTAMATTDTPLSRLSPARPLSPPSTTMARGLLKLSLLPMLMPKLTLGYPTDTTAMVMDSTGHTDTAATGVDIPMAATDMVPTDTTDKDTASKLISAQILPKCVQRVNLSILNLIYQRVLKPKKKKKKKFLWGFLKKKKKKKKKKS